MRTAMHRTGMQQIFLVALPISLLTVFFIMTGLLGLDFGHHWDEAYTQIEPLKKSIQAKTLLPGQYLYPSATYWLNFFGVLAYALPRILSEHKVQAALLQALNDPGLLLWLRGLRVAVSALSLIWVYLGVVIWRRKPAQALLAAALLGLSWEVGYHARYVAVDCLQMQFAALTFLLLIAAWQFPQRRIWLYLSAIGAGLVTGSKYPGALMIAPVLIVAFHQWHRDRGLRYLLLDAAKLLFVFGATFLVTTPGMLLQPWAFQHWIAFQMNIYSQGHLGHTIGTGAPILASMCSFFGFALFSRFFPIALFFGLSALIGIYGVLRQSWKTGVMLLALPLLYLLYFSTLRVMIVRNLLILAPFLAVFAAEGVVLIWRWLQHRYLRWGLVLGVLVMLAVNAAWLLHSAQSIRYRGTNQYIKEFIAFSHKQPNGAIYVSPRVAAASIAENGMLPQSMTRDASLPTVTYYAVYLREKKDYFYYSAPATGPFLLEGWFGPMEANMNYYPNWLGDDRIMLISKRQVSRLNMPIP